MATLLADLEDTSGDVPVVAHTHAVPTLWERENARLWLYATLELLRSKAPPQPKTH